MQVLYIKVGLTQPLTDSIFFSYICGRFFSYSNRNDRSGPINFSTEKEKTKRVKWTNNKETSEAGAKAKSKKVKLLMDSN